MVASLLHVVTQWGDTCLVFYSCKRSAPVSQKTESVWSTKSSQSVLNRKRIAVYCEMRTMRADVVCGRAPSFLILQT
jgi:hypothetical protein